MKKILCILLSLLLVLLNGCSSDTGNIRFGAAGVGGMYYTFANSFTGILSKENENYSYEVKNTAGSTANIRLLSNHYIDLAIAQADLIQDAYEGTGAFDGNICKDYSAIAGLYTEACQIVVRADSSIYSLDDLQGKHISIGASESGTERNAKEILAATGLTSRLVQTENYDYTQAANQLSNHEIDAFFCTAGTKTTIIEELAKECPIRLLSLNETCLKKLMASSPSYIHYTIPANTYTRQDKEVTTIGVKSILLASDDLSEDTVNIITKALFEHNKDLQYATSLNLALNETSATKDITLPFHKGAASYYKEKKITVSTKEQIGRITMNIEFDMYQTLALAVLVLLLGSFLKKHIHFLEKFCIPAPVIGGLLFAILTCIGYSTGLADFTFDDTLREVCMVFFFTSVGFQANLKVLKSGGKSVGRDE